MNYEIRPSSLIKKTSYIINKATVWKHMTMELDTASVYLLYTFSPVLTRVSKRLRDVSLIRHFYLIQSKWWVLLV